MEENAIIGIYTIKGQLVFEHLLVDEVSSLPLNIEHFSTGYYFVKVQANGMVETRKVLVVR